MFTIRNSPVLKIRRCLKECESKGIPMNPEFLEMHFLAGGNIEDLLSGLLYTQEQGMAASAETVAAHQLAEQYGDKRSVVENLKEFQTAGITVIDGKPIKVEYMDT